MCGMSMRRSCGIYLQADEATQARRAAVLQTMEEATDMPVPEPLKELVPAGERCCVKCHRMGSSLCHAEACHDNCAPMQQ